MEKHRWRGGVYRVLRRPRHNIMRTATYTAAATATINNDNNNNKSINIIYLFIQGLHKSNKAKYRQSLKETVK
jgi:hypothetical protein